MNGLSQAEGKSRIMTQKILNGDVTSRAEMNNDRKIIIEKERLTERKNGGNVHNKRHEKKKRI